MALRVLPLYYTSLMTETAHIFTPTDDSLEARIKAYQSSVNLLFSAEQSRKTIKRDDREDTNYIGTKEEVDEAYVIARNSMSEALNAISVSEIEEALEKSYITKVQAKEFIVFSQQFNMTHYRSTKRSTHSMKHSRKL